MAYLLDNPVRAYAWGSPTAIPDLLGVAPTGEPQAELWLGAHPGAPSAALTAAGPVALDQLIRRDPAGTLGAPVVGRYGIRLPFLLKVLAVERPLSIQAHPTTEQARSGYDAENAAGVPADAPERTFRDRCHKPELVVALSEFEALLGFRKPADARDLIAGLGIPGLGAVAQALRRPDGLRQAVHTVFDLGHDDGCRLATAVAAACRTRPGGPFSTLAWIAEAYPGDPGLLVALLLEPLRLHAGDAVAVPTGIPHAYLRGLAVEAQASSDNTVRAGLTPKHVDRDALLRILRYEPAGDLRPVPATGSSADEFAVPGVPDFRLTRFMLGTDPMRLPGGVPRIVLVTRGRVTLTADGAPIGLGSGASAFVPAGDTVVALTGPGTAFVVGPGGGENNAAR
ncbi:MAG: mannose-6-phosphate isomerase, class I [Jiangellaceae bacterium]